MLVSSRSGLAGLFTLERKMGSQGQHSVGVIHDNSRRKALSLTAAILWRRVMLMVVVMMIIGRPSSLFSAALTLFCAAGLQERF